MRAPAYGSYDAPVAFRRPLRKFLVGSAESLSSVGLLYEVSSFGPRMYFIYRKSGKAVGVIATRVDDISACGGPELLLELRFAPEKDLGN